MSGKRMRISKSVVSMKQQRQRDLWMVLLIVVVPIVLPDAAAAFQESRLARRPMSRLYNAPSSSSPSFPLLPELPNPFRSSNSEPPKSPPPPFLLDGSDASLFQQAQRLIQSDFGVTDPSLLDDDAFRFIGPNLEQPLSKTDYLAAARFFNLRAAFPDYDYRAHDFRRVVDDNTNDASTVRCTARATGTMRGALRLRNAVLAPTGQVLRGPPEAISITLDPRTGRVTKLCLGFVLDRFVGNTRGLTGVRGASIIAGADSSVWEVLPPAAVLASVFGRPALPLPETTTFLAPFPETVMIQLAKGVLAAQMGADDPTLLSDTAFSYCTPTVGPIRKAAFLEQYARAELGSFEELGATHWRIDPYDPVRVWVDLAPTAAGYVGPPQAMSLAFDDDGYCTRITAQAVMDPSLGNAGGLGGPDGVAYARGQARPGIFTRPLSRSVERWRLRLLSPITGTAVDTFQLPPKQRVWPWEASTPSVTAPTQPTISQTTAAKATVPPRPPAQRPLTPRERVAQGTLGKAPQPPRTEPPALDQKVVQRLERLKEFTTSIRIIPPTPAVENDRLAASRRAAQKSQQAMLKAQREAQVLQQQLAAEERKARAQQAKAQQQAEKDKELARQQQAAQKVEKAKELARQQVEKAKEQARQQQAAQKAEKAKEQARQQQLQATQKAEKAKELARQQQLQAAQKAEKAKELARQQQQAELEKAAEARRQQAKLDAEIQRQEMEAQRVAAAAAAETRKVQAMKEQLEQKRRMTTVMKANRAAQAPSTSRTPSRSVYKSETDGGVGNALGGLARSTISLFGLGKPELEELPVSATAKVSRAPVGVPTITRWRSNADQSITGLVKGSRNFDDGSRITTSPITGGTVQSGEVVRTGSGSRYFLE